MKRLLLIALTAGLVAQPADLSAQLFYNGIPDATEYLDFIQGSGVASGGVQVGPYRGQFLETPLAPAFSIYCVDYDHFAKDQWVNVTSFASADLSKTRLGDAATYRRLAYLSSLFDATSQSEWGNIHRAIWNIASGESFSSTGSYMTMAVPATFSTDGWYVLSPTSLTSTTAGQEFLMRSSVSVPEPATLLLMATGLLLLAAFSRRRLVELTRE